MTDTTTGSDLYDCVEKCLNELEVDWNNFSSITTDGAPAMLGVKAELVSRLKLKAKTCNVNLKSLHCIIYQESLCSKKIKMEHVMDIVIKTINWIRSRTLNHRQFSTLLDFPTLKQLSTDSNDSKKYISHILLLKNEFMNRFADFQKYKNDFLLFSEPFSINVEHVREDLQLELIDFQCNSVLN